MNVGRVMLARGARGMVCRVGAPAVNQRWVVGRQERAFRDNMQLLAEAEVKDQKVDPKKKKKRGGVLAQVWGLVLHTYHGMRLLVVNTKVAVMLQKRVLSGSQLTRRERQLLERTTKDLIRMVPFSFFIIVPGAELLLPVALMMFPDLTPSTFTTRDQVRKKQIVDNLKKGSRIRRIFEHTFSRIIIDEGYDLYSSSWGILKRVGKGDIISAADIREISRHFQSGRKLDLKNLPSWVVRDVARVLGLYSPWPGTLLPTSIYDARLRYAIEEYFEKMAEDDKSLLEAMDSLSEEELEKENMKRNMRWFGPTSALKLQLKYWCEISLADEVPSHVLAFVRPCATSHKAMLKSLSKDEVDHVLGLEKYFDAPMRQRLKKLTGGVKEVPLESIDNSIMEDELNDIKDRVTDINQEVLAADEVFKHVREVLKDYTAEEILHFYQIIVTEECTVRPCDEQRGVKVIILARELLKYFKKKDPNIKLTAFRLIMCLREFDIDASDVITEDEFNSFLSRIKQ